MIRVTAHPKDPAFLVLKIDQDHNQVVGSFQPAHRQDDMGIGVYVMEAEHLPALKTWARYQSIHLLNEVRGPVEPTKPLQCGNVIGSWAAEDGRTVYELCLAPLQASFIPKVCGTCGQTPSPEVFEESEPAVGTRCPSCDRLSRGGPRFCPGCGGPMPDHRLKSAAVQVPRGGPVTLGQAVGELAGQNGSK